MNKKLSITFLVCNPDLSGGDRVIAEHAKMLRDRGHAVTILGVDTHQFSFRNYARTLIKKRRLPEKHIRTDHFDNNHLPIKLVKRPTGIMAEDLSDNNDIVIATWWETAEWLAHMPDNKGKKVYFIQGYEPWVPSVTDPERVERTYKLPFTQMGVSQWICDQVDVISQTPHGTKCILVENGIDLKKFSTSKRNKNKRPTIGFLYSRAALKNIDLSLQAIEILREKRSDLRIISFGAYPQTPELSLPANTEFHLRPAQEKIPALYASCDVWLFSSNHEGFGLPILEAMACRTPVVATQAGASPEIVTTDTGRLCLERTPEAFAKAIEEVLALADNDWREMSDHAYHQAQHYSWDRAATSFEAALYRAYDT